MRVERQGRKIQVVLKEGNQERWFNIEEHEAQELATRIADVIAEPKTNVWLRSMSSYAHKQAKELKVEAQDAKYHVDVASKAEGAKEVWEWVANAIDTRLRRMLN